MSEMETTAGSGRVGTVIVLGLCGWGGGGGAFLDSRCCLGACASIVCF